MRVVNLDKLTTRKDKVIILNGVEHVMRTPTVADYIDQMKKAEEISAIAEMPTIETATKMLELTIATLRTSFPTVTAEQFAALDMDQLNAIRELAESAAGDDLAEGDGAEGEASGKVD
jgi:hypothetical protein